MTFSFSIWMADCFFKRYPEALHHCFLYIYMSVWIYWLKDWRLCRASFLDRIFHVFDLWTRVIDKRLFFFSAGTARERSTSSRSLKLPFERIYLKGFLSAYVSDRFVLFIGNRTFTDLTTTWLASAHQSPNFFRRWFFLNCLGSLFCSQQNKNLLSKLNGDCKQRSASMRQKVVSIFAKRLWTLSPSN